jgi:hypothetical protein
MQSSAPLTTESTNGQHILNDFYKVSVKNLNFEKKNEENLN